MRLQELIDFNPRVTNKDLGSYRDKILSKTKSTMVGYGSYADVYDIDSNKRKNQVTKIGSLSPKGFSIGGYNIEDDGYLLYIRAVNNYNKLGRVNPYFPVIHDLKIMKNQRGIVHYNVKLEKLLPSIPTESEKVVNEVFNNMFGPTPGGYHIFDLSFHLSNGLNSLSTIKDENLKIALQLIRGILRSNGAVHPDLRYPNLMWRQTDNLPQLVITDPIA